MTNKEEGWPRQAISRRILLLGGMSIIVLGMVLLVVVVLSSRLGATSVRSESYKSISGTAGLIATIDYKCDGECKQKYDFDVRIFRDAGPEVAVVRPDNKGIVNVALPEGEYVMLINKKIDSGNTFPQEHISLKNGKQLELKLQYKGMAS
ncbi:MAG TPA: hypothetical protein VJ841_01370 [Candidatus Saccharimonadales bacterium]|nr:hypothetical protein [Candidatus Saccharimonadales bacterium]